MFVDGLQWYIVQPTVCLLVELTLAKDEKYVAELFNSPEWDAIHFMSAGISSNLKITGFPCGVANVFPSISLISDARWLE